MVDLNNEKVINFFRYKIKDKLKGLSKVGQIEKFKLLPEESAQENGLLTLTLKLRWYNVLAYI
jgi:long-subunit acyl-CoA synthetase (AMP-forming)